MTGKKRQSEEGDDIWEEASGRICATKLLLDLQLEILSWLPAATVLRLRPVCTKWNDGTRRANFVEKHLTRSIQLQKNSSTTNFLLWPNGKSFRNDDSTVMVEMGGEEDETRRLTTHHPLLSHNNYFSLFSSDGLLCVHLNRFSILVVNPTNNKHRPLPLPSFPCTRILVHGFDNKKKEYKVVAEVEIAEGESFNRRHSAVCEVPLDGPPRPWRIISDSSNKQQLIAMDTMWEDAATYADVGWMIAPTPPALVNGLFHWVSINGLFHEGVMHSLVSIQSFDLQNDKFDVVSIERVHLPLRHPCMSSVVEVEGCLGLVVLHESGEMELWRLMEYENHDSWLPIFYPKSQVLASLPMEKSYSRLHCLWKGGKLFICVGGRIVCCNLDTNQFLLRFMADDGFLCMPFVSSLFS